MKIQFDKWHNIYIASGAGPIFFIPSYMMGGLKRYFEDGIPPGDFLRAVLENDLREAVGRADETNLSNLPAYVHFLHNEVPAGSWGSPLLVAAWIAEREKERKVEQ